MKLPLSTRMVDKALAAMTSAVEVYNRASFAYREETFAILALNAWELLLKAKLVKEAGNNPRAIWVYEPRQLKNGKLSTKLYIRTNRTGNPMSKALRGCVSDLTAQNKPLDPQVEDNLRALTAIRDNATHYFSAGRELTEKTAEVATASVKNFVLLVRDWFGEDFADHFTLCLPLAFLSGPAKIQTVVTGGEKKLIDYLNNLAAKPSPATDYAVSLRLEVKVDKTNATGAIKFQPSKDADAIKVDMSEEDVRKIYPWDYAKLTGHLKGKIPGFLVNEQYHQIRMGFQKDPKYGRERFLDPGNPKSPKKMFFNPNIAGEIEKAYKLL